MNNQLRQERMRMMREGNMDAGGGGDDDGDDVANALEFDDV